MWDYICPKCRKEVERNSSRCPHCEELYDQPIRVPPKVLKDSKALEKYVHEHVFPRVSKAQRNYLAQYFTELFSDGFEDDFDNWSTTYGSPTTVSSPVYEGQKCMQCSGNGDFVGKVTDSMSELYLRAYVRFDNLPTQTYSRCRFLALYTGSGSSSFARVMVEGDGSNPKWGLYYRNAGSGYSARSSTGLSTDTWYCVELRVLTSSADGVSDGEYHVWVDGTELTDLAQTGVDTDYTNINYAVAGAINVSNLSLNTYVDSVVVSDAYIGLGSETYTKTWTTDALFKKLGITKNLIVDTAFQKQDIPKTFGLDSTFQKSFTIQKQLDALFKKLDKLETFGIDTGFLKRNIIKSFAVDARFSALMRQTISRQIDALLKKLDATKTFGLDAHFGAGEAETYAKNFALDTIFAYKVRLPELWLDENGKIVLNISKPYTWVGT
jgi:hypothetical protein